MEGSSRTRAERDAVTVEIGYAPAGAAFLAAVVFGVVAGPVFVWHLPHPVAAPLLVTATTAAGPLGVARVVHVPRRLVRLTPRRAASGATRRRWRSRP